MEIFDEDEERVEAEKLAQGMLHIIHSNEKLINLVAKLVNTHGIKNTEVRGEFQKAYNSYNEGKKLLEEIGFFKPVQ